MTNAKKGLNSDLSQAVDDCHKVFGWLVPILDIFPKSRRYTLGAKMEKELLEALEALLNATYSSGTQRKGALQRANRKSAVDRHLLRLALELRVCSLSLYQHGAKLIVELGRQISGWKKGGTVNTRTAIPPQPTFEQYLRYVDDLIVLSNNKQRLWQIHENITIALAENGLTLHPRKVFLQPTRLPLHVLGFLVTPRGRRLRPDNGNRFARRLRKAATRCQSGEKRLSDFSSSFDAWIGHSKHDHTRALRAKMFKSLQFTSGPPSSSVAQGVLEQ